MTVRGTLVARRKATLCLQLWLGTTASSSGPLAAASISAASSGWSQRCFQCFQLLTPLCLSSYIWNKGGLLCSPEPPRLPVWWMSPSKSVSTSTPKRSLDSCMTQTRSASGSLVPRPNCAALILSRWDIPHHICPHLNKFHTSVAVTPSWRSCGFLFAALLNWGFITRRDFFTKAWTPSTWPFIKMHPIISEGILRYIGLYVWRIHGCWFTCKCPFNDYRALIAGKSTLPGRTYEGLTCVTLFGCLQLL